jgi:hypothetical protein
MDLIIKAKLMTGDKFSKNFFNVFEKKVLTF